MIRVEKIRKLVEEDLMKKNHNGYISTEEFNRFLELAEVVLLNYFCYQHEQGTRVADSVQPFVTSKNILVTAGVAALPIDYRQRISADFMYNTCTGGTPTKKPISYYNSAAIARTEQSPIRRSSQNKHYYTFTENGIQVYPTDSNGTIVFRYLRNAVHAKWVGVLDPTLDEEVYDPAASVDSEYKEQDTNNIVLLILYYAGMATRDSELINWAASQGAIYQNIK